jgi:hypothetical protein
MKTILLLILSAFPFLLSVSSQAQESPQEQQLVDKLNAARREAGLSALQVDHRLVEAARQHSQKMADQNSLGHVLPGEDTVANRIAATGLRFNRSGENVAYNTDFNGLHTGWMNSPPHRENILDSHYTLVGIGVVKSDDGVYWATQDFARGETQRTDDQAEDMAAQSFSLLRKRSGAPAMQRVMKSEIHELACSMGEAGRLNPKQVLALPGVHYAITYNNSRPEELPSSARGIAGAKQLREYAVGACFRQEKSNPGGTYYVVMAFY